jgi:hypothetical protein
LDRVFRDFAAGRAGDFGGGFAGERAAGLAGGWGRGLARGFVRFPGAGFGAGSGGAWLGSRGATGRSMTLWLMPGGALRLSEYLRIASWRSDPASIAAL